MVTQSCSPSQLSAEDFQLYQLGKMIEEGIPYEYASGEPTFTLDSPSTPSPASPFIPDAAFGAVWVDGPLKDFPSAAGKGVLPTGAGITEETVRDKPSQSFWWSFAGRQYRVTKAYMVPYTVQDPGHPDADTHGVLTRHVLVGYMGVDSHGG
jgi:hypothetical protein